MDTVVAKYAIMLNGLTHINLTKLDVLTGVPTLKILTGYPSEYIEMPGWTEPLDTCTSFDQLPTNAQNYVIKLEELLSMPITFIGVGYNRNQLISK